MEFIANYFNFDKRNTTYKAEIVGGFTTFFTMAYALFLIPDVLSLTGMPKDAAFVATGLSAAIGTLTMGILGKSPMGLAPGIGLNAFFTFSVCLGMGISWEVALAGVFVSGIIFLLLSLTGLREKIINAIPNVLKHAVTGGIGLFIAFIGLQKAGIVVGDSATLVALGNLADPNVLLSIFGLFAIGVLMVKRVNIAIFVGMALTVIVGMLSGLIDLPTAIISMPPSIAETFGVALKHLPEVFTPQMMMVVFTFLFMDFFDTAGTIVAVGQKTGLIKEDGTVEGSSRALLADSLATVIGSVLGTTNTTSYIESLSGISVGARTGFASVVTGVLFLIALLFSPLLSVITASVTAPALILVGVLMCSSLVEIDWNTPEIAIPAFLTIIMMPLSYSIAEGIAFGFISYVVMTLFAGKEKRQSIHPIMFILAILFTFYFISFK
ncbi:MAG: NCS2 family permease [Turicibacter sp.]